MRKAYWVLFVLSICGHLAIAQNPDSFRRVAYERVLQDTTKVRLYALASYAYHFSNPDSMQSLASKGILLADKLHFEKGKAQCLAYMGLASLIKYELDKGIKYCNESIAIYGKTNDSTAMEPAFFYLGAIYYNLTKYSLAIQNYEICARINNSLKNYDALANTYTNIGSCYSAMGNYPEALNYFLKGFKVNEQRNDKGGIATSLGNIGQVYADMGNNKKAVEYVEQSIAIKDNGLDVANQINNLENAGGVFLVARDHKNALSAFNEALHKADSAKLDGSQIDRILCNLGEVYVDEGDYDNGVKVYQRCLQDPEISINPMLEGLSNRGMGKIAVAKGSLKEGIDYLQKALRIFKTNNLKREIDETADDLRKAYEKNKDYVHALESTNMYYDYRDSLYNEKNDLKVQQLQFDYLLQKKQSQIELLKQNKVIAQIRTWALVSGLVLLIIIIVLLYRSRQHEKHTKEMISRQAANLDELNRFKDKVFSVLSHDLGGPINTLSATMTMLGNDEISTEEFNELKPEVDKQLSNITFLLDNLLKWSKNYLTAGKVLKPEAVDLYQIAAQNISLADASARRKGITIINNIPHAIAATADMGQIDIVIRNLLSNAIKFTNAGGQIALTAEQGTHNVKLTVADTGIGMDATQLSKLFTTATDNSTYGTAGEKGIGLGLLLCYDFIKANNGNITVTSTINGGSTFTIELPK